MAHHKLTFEERDRLDSDERRRRQPVEPIVELVVEEAPAAVVDWGVGTGTFAIPLAEAMNGGSVVGLDVEPRMLELVERRAAAAGVDDRVSTRRVGPTGPLPFDDGSVDVVLMVNLYHELDDRPGALREALRVLRVGGRLVVCDWDPEGDGEHGPSPQHRVAAAVAVAEMAAAGFAAAPVPALYDDFWIVVGRR